MYMKYAFQWYITIQYRQILHFYQTFWVLLLVSAGFRDGGGDSLKWGEIAFS